VEVRSVEVLSARRSSLVGEVVERLRKVIDQKGMAGGERLPTEAQLIAQLGVSRTVLREAVGRLEAIGMIDVRHGQGMFVGDRDGLTSCAQLARSAMSITNHDHKHFADLRCAIEYHAVRQAAERADPAQIAELETLFRKIACEDQTFDEAMRVDFAFHRKLVEIAGNPLTLDMFTMLQEFVLAGMKQVSQKPRDFKGAYRIHRPIFEAVRAGDPDAAEAAMRKHMDYYNERMAELE
jgi:GntR family transcriptional repressor for pyruvate dehydrogenase complex